MSTAAFGIIVVSLILFVGLAAWMAYETRRTSVTDRSTAVRDAQTSANKRRRPHRTTSPSQAGEAGSDDAS